MVQIYRQSFRYYWVSLPILLLFATLIDGSIWLLQPKSEMAITLVPLIIVAYMFHRHFLFGEYMTNSGGLSKAALQSRPMKFGWFSLASIGLLAIPITIAVAVTISMGLDTHNRGPLVVTLMLIMLPLYLLVLSLFGTVLPALVERNKAYRVSSGMRAFFQTLWRLLLGPTVVGTVLLAVLTGADHMLANVPFYNSTAGQLVVGIASRTVGFLPTLLAVAVLCHVYQMVMSQTTSAPSAAPSAQ